MIMIIIMMRQRIIKLEPFIKFSLSHLFSGFGINPIPPPSSSSIFDIFPNLIYLHIGDKFDGIISSLPSSLQTLYLGNKYNHPLPPLPSSLLKLHIGDEFNHPVINLPSSLQSLHLGDDFDNTLILPSNLIKLSFSISNRDKQLHLPSTLQKLTLGCKMNPQIDSYPPSLLSLIALAPWDCSSFSHFSRYLFRQNNPSSLSFSRTISFLCYITSFKMIFLLQNWNISEQQTHLMLLIPSLLLFLICFLNLSIQQILLLLYVNLSQD